MTTYILLLRGINVGVKNKDSMTALKTTWKIGIFQCFIVLAFCRQQRVTFPSLRK